MGRSTGVVLGGLCVWSGGWWKAIARMRVGALLFFPHTPTTTTAASGRWPQLKMVGKGTITPSLPTHQQIQIEFSTSLRIQAPFLLRLPCPSTRVCASFPCPATPPAPAHFCRTTQWPAQSCFGLVRSPYGHRLPRPPRSRLLHPPCPG